jgi:hypothetical protein
VLRHLTSPLLHCSINGPCSTSSTRFVNLSFTRSVIMLRTFNHRVLRDLRGRFCEYSFFTLNRMTVAPNRKALHRVRVGGSIEQSTMKELVGTLWPAAKCCQTPRRAGAPVTCLLGACRLGQIRERDSAACRSTIIDVALCQFAGFPQARKPSPPPRR